MSNRFQIIPKKLTADEKYDPVNNNLVLKESGSFNVTINELESLIKKKPVEPAKIKVLSDKEFDALTNLEKKLYTEKVEKYNSSIATYNKNQRDYQTKLKPYKNLNWAWRIAGLKLVPDEITHNESFSKGVEEILDFKDKIIKFPKLLEGGGIAWLEAWPDDQKSTAKIGTGLCVQAEGIPEVVKIEWTDFDYEPLKDVKITFMSEVILHIYTKGMYGQDVEVYLIDKDTFDNDGLDISKDKCFTRQVDIYQIKDNDSHEKIVTDFIVKADQNAPNEEVEREIYVQKIEIQVLIDEKWKIQGGNHLKIFPVVKSLKTETFFKNYKRDCLEVSTDKESQIRQVAAEITNKPLLAGKVESNVANFLPCRFDTIKLDDVDVFNSGNIYHRAKSTIDIDIIAGKKELHLIDFAFKTKECGRKPVKHSNCELSILSVPKNFTLNIGAGADAKHPAKEEELIKVKNTSSSKTTFLKGLSTTTEEEHKKEAGTIAVTQHQIQFDSFFNYNVDINSISKYVKIAKYFWLGDSFTKSAEILRIKALASTCAFQKNINIAIYPDIKWSIVFGFNVEEEQLKVLRPNWDQENTIKRYSWNNDTFTEKLQNKLNSDISKEEKKKVKKELKKLNKQNKTNDRINERQLVGYARENETDLKKERRKQEKEEKEREKNRTEKGKLSTLVDIMKDVEVSVTAEIYGDTKLELTREFIESTVALAKQYKDLYEKVKWAIDVLGGKHDVPTNQAEGDIEIKALLDNAKSSKIKGLQESLARSGQETEILFPKFSIGANWQFEKVDGAKYPEYEGRSGLGYAVAFAADPLIGIELKWHILDLLCRKHPIAYAVLAAVKTIMATLTENPDAIVVDFWVKGQISTDITFSGNQLAGDKKVTAKGDAHITTGIEISITIEGKVTVGSYTSVAKVGVGATGEIGLGIIGNLGIDDQGVWMQSSLAFDGIKLTFTAVIGAKITKKRMTEDGEMEEVEIAEKESKIEIEITMLEHTLESDKFYLN